MERVQLPDGCHAVLRDKVTVGGRQALQRTVGAAFAAIKRVRKLREDAQLEDIDPTEDTPVERIPYTEKELQSLQRFEMAGVLALLKHWTREEDIPRTIDDVEEMDPAIYEILTKKTTPTAWKALRRPSADLDEGFVKDAATGSPVAVPDSPTGPSTATDAGERAPLETPSSSSTLTRSSSPSLESETSEPLTPA